MSILGTDAFWIGFFAAAFVMGILWALSSRKDQIHRHTLERKIEELATEKEQVPRQVVPR
jgi:hypothetical protein